MRRWKRCWESLRDKFEDAMAEVDTSDENACWLWPGPPDRKGYGVIWWDGKRPGAHRAALILYKNKGKPIPDGKHVLHSCDNPPCVNPAHLRLGTNADNVADRAEKGRTARGERNGNAKKTDAEVLCIREMYASGKKNMVELAVFFGVDQSLIGHIIHRKKWKHI